VLREGGAGGPALERGQLMNVSTGGAAEGPYCILVRVHPDIRRVEVTAQAGETMNMPVYDSPDFPDVRFAVLLVPRDLRLSAVIGLGPDGRQLERFDRGFHQRFWHDRRPRPGQPPSAG
jgi:hypothetical protein